MKLDRTLKVLLVLMLASSLADMFSSSGFYGSVFAQSEEETGEKEEVQYLSINAWREGEASSAISIVCSSDGRYVFVTDGGYIYRSDEYGKIGSWEKVLR